MKKIGIIGGAGPEAGASLFMNIIRLYQLRGAIQDCDFPYITLLNVPFAPMLTLEDIQRNKKTLQAQLQEAFDRLSACEVIAIACNTLHTIVPRASLPGFVSIVHAAQDALEAKNIKRALFLGTSTSVALQLYEGSIPVIYPNKTEQKEIDRIILDVLANDFSGSKKLAHIINMCRSRDAFDGIILGCTELPLLHEKNPIETQLLLFDTLSILAHTIVKHSF